MSGFKKILIPTDFSENATKAAEYALKTFADKAESFEFLHTYKLRYAGGVMTTDLEAIMSKDRHEEMDECVEKMKAQFPGANIKSNVVQGTLLTTIDRIIEEHGVDLLVIGTTGATGITEHVLGSNASNIMQSIKKPVLLVPNDCKIGHTNKVVFASDLKELESSESLETIYEAVNAMDLDVHILNLLTKDLHQEESEQEISRITGLFKNREPEFHFRKITEAEDDILDFCHEIQADLLVVIARDYGFFGNLLHRSLSRKLSMHTDLPLLVLKEG